MPSIVLDQGELGKEASWAGAGNCCRAAIRRPRPTPLEQLRALTVSRFAEFSEDLRSRTGVDNGYLRSGGLEFADAESPSTTGEWQGPGVPWDSLDEARKPCRRTGVGTRRSWTRPLHAAGWPSGVAIRGKCKRSSRRVQTFRGPDGWPLVDLRPGASVVSILREANRIEAVATTNEIVSGDRFLIAAGAWSGVLLKPLGIALPVEPVRGQIVLLNPGPPLFASHFWFRVAYTWCRAPEGRITGPVRRKNTLGFQKQTTAAGVQGLLEFATRLIPDLAAAKVEQTWAGLEAGEPRSDAVSGTSPGTSRICSSPPDIIVRACNCRSAPDWQWRRCCRERHLRLISPGLRSTGDDRIRAVFRTKNDETRKADRRQVAWPGP